MALITCVLWVKEGCPHTHTHSLSLAHVMRSSY